MEQEKLNRILSYIQDFYEEKKNWKSILYQRYYNKDVGKWKKKKKEDQSDFNDNEKYGEDGYGKLMLGL